VEAKVRSVAPHSNPKAPPSKGFFRTYLRPHAAELAAGLFLTLLLGLVTAPIPVLLGPALQVIADPTAMALRMDELFGSFAGPWAVRLSGRETIGAPELLGMLPLAIAVAALLKAVVSAAQWFLFERLGERIALAMRRDLVAGYLALDPSRRRSEVASRREAELSSAVTNDVRMVREFFVHYYGGLPRELAQTIVLTVWLYILSPKLFLIFLLGLAPLGAALSRVSKKLRRRAQQALQDYSQLSEWLQQRLLGVETIKHYGTEAIESEKMRRLNDELRHRFMRAARVKARTSPLIEALATVAGAVVLIIALRDVNSGVASGATQLSFFSTLGILSQSASKLGRYLNSNREGAAALGRLAALLEDLRGAAVEIVEVKSSEAAVSRVVCEGLCVRYEGAADDALEGFSYAFEAGRVYCLVGPSGAGKSTLFNLLLGLVRPSGGHVCFEAQGAASHAARVAYMPQKVQLVPGTLGENVAYPDAVYDAARVSEALARVGLVGLAASLPGGLDEAVGEGGRGLSGGQAQRILLARLWYREAPFVLVDEGTSALDPEVEQLVFELLRALARRGAVVVMIAHRMAATAIADVLLLLDGGRLAVHGEPRQVMASRSFQDVLS
jgi:subfamily B ATP-binding cassette protein MsbA